MNDIKQFLIDDLTLRGIIKIAYAHPLLTFESFGVNFTPRRWFIRIYEEYDDNYLQLNYLQYNINTQSYQAEILSLWNSYAIEEGIPALLEDKLEIDLDDQWYMK